jgi:hypothetical protein
MNGDGNAPSVSELKQLKQALTSSIRACLLLAMAVAATGTAHTHTLFIMIFDFSLCFPAFALVRQQGLCAINHYLGIYHLQVIS